MDRRTTLALALCFLIYVGWQKYYLEPRMQHGQPAAPTSQIQNESSSGQPMAQGNPSQSTSSAPQTPVRPTLTQVVPSGTGDAAVGDGPYLFMDWNLKSYRLGISPDAAAVDMKSVTRQSGEVELSFNDPKLAYLTNVHGVLSKTQQGALWTYEDANVKITKDVRSVPGQPYLDLRINTEFKSQHPHYSYVSLTSEAAPQDPEARDRQLVYWANESIERVQLKDTIKSAEVTTPVKYIAATGRYFLMALVAQTGSEPRALVQSIGPNAGRISLVYPISSNTLSIPLRAYFGPKELDVLRSVEPTLDHTVDFGWFTIFAYPILRILKLIYEGVHNYGVAIIILTLLLKIVTYPLTYKSMKSMKEMAKLQPQLQKLREKYKDDKEALNREMMVMMRSHGYNPVAGCLPMVIQMPIFFALYRVLYSSIDLYHAPFAFWIHDLSAKDPFYVTPILLSVTMFIQQRLTPNTATDPAQARMMQFMPLIFGAFMLPLPSGLTLYMLVNAIAGIGQQMILNKKLDSRHAPTLVARAR